MKKLFLALSVFFTIVAQASVTITPTTLPNGYVQHPYAQVLTATGGTKPYTMRVSSGTAPTGLYIISGTVTTANLSGTPTAAGVFSFTVTATDANGSTGIKGYTVTITQRVLTAAEITNDWYRQTPDYPTLWDTWNSVSPSASSTTVTVPNGGTGKTSFTPYTVICAGTTSVSALQNVSGVGSSGQVLTSNGASALPTWQTPTTVSSGTFTPTVVAGNNVTIVSTSPAQYMRVGNKVMVSGAISVSAASGSPSDLTMSFPVASTLGFSYQCSGTSSTTTTGDAGVIRGDNSLNKGIMFFNPSGNLTGDIVEYQYMYQVLP